MILLLQKINVFQFDFFRHVSINFYVWDINLGKKLKMSFINIKFEITVSAR